MAQRPPKRYEPGELDRTRRHLGEVSPEEARRMAEVLGGEVGVEKTAGEIEEKYRRIGDLNRRKSDRFVASAPPGQQEADDEAPRSRRKAHSTRRRAAKHSRYSDRIRMDFLAARPDHQIKTRSAAFASLCSPFFFVADTVNPRFIANGDELYFTHIENLVLSVRQLLARYAKSPRTLMRVPYYEQLLAVIKDWNLEALSRELARLQEHPRGVPVQECAELCRMLYRPIVRLIDVDQNYHVAQALKHIFDVDVMSVPKESPEVAKIKLAYTMSRDGLVRVFTDLKQRLYPLLMKLACSTFSAYSDFFADNRKEILTFLDLSPSELIAPKQREAVVPQAPAEPAEDVSEESEGEPEVGEEVPRELVEDLVRALEFLDELFPQAGFRRLDEFPDLYPYFQPILKLPKGSELIPAGDPLQQIIVLVACLQEIFYGFRSIDFQVMGDEESGFVATAQKVESLTGNWHLFLDEIVGKLYISTLYEYCRQVGDGISTLRASDYAARLEAQLMWSKRHFFLPHLKVKAVRGMHLNIPSDLPRLSETVAEMRGLLERVIADVADGRMQSMQNPWQNFSFAVESYLSRRLRLVLGRRENPEFFLDRRISNVSLVFHTLLILRALDYLINDETSFYAVAYADARRPLFRSDAVRNGEPLYNVAVEDPFALIEQYEARLSREPARNHRQSPIDRLTQMETSRSMMGKVRTLMKSAELDKSFVLLTVTMRRYSEIAGERGSETAERWLKEVATVITAQIRDFEDIPYRVGSGAFIIVMPATTADGAIHLAERLAERFRTVENGEIPISLGVVQYDPGWSLERLLKTTQSAVREAAKLASPSLVCHEPTTDTFVPYSDPSA